MINPGVRILGIMTPIRRKHIQRRDTRIQVTNDDYIRILWTLLMNHWKGVKVKVGRVCRGNITCAEHITGEALQLKPYLVLTLLYVMHGHPEPIWYKHCNTTAMSFCIWRIWACHCKSSHREIIISFELIYVRNITVGKQLTKFFRLELLNPSIYIYR